jgi:hypothetical protein
LVVTNHSSTEKEQQASDMCGFSQIECCHKKRSIPLPFIKEVLNMVTSHEMYYFLNGFLRYHQIMIAWED